jgi:hypothetical protein
MDSIIQHIVLTARTLQGMTPIFVEYALWIALSGLLLFVIGEILARIVRYKDNRIDWVARAYDVNVTDVLPLPSPALLGRETLHPTKRIRNPFRLIGEVRSPHQGDYIVRGSDGVVLASVYNWRGYAARNAKDTQKAGQVEMVETKKARFVSGFLRDRVVFSPDQDCKDKAATLSAAMVARHRTQSRVSAMCLHKNRPPHLATRNPRRDANGRLAAHIDIEQIRHHKLPAGTGGRIDDETWYDLRGWVLRQPGRMMSAHKTSARVTTLIVLLALFAHTEASTISEFEIEIIKEYFAEVLYGDPAGRQSQAHPGPR